MQIKKTNQNDIEALMEIRLEMLRVVNGLDENVAFDKILVDTSREYFLNGDQTTVFAMDGDRIAGCASISYIWIMPTFSHPTGKRGHLMNVYTRKEYRRQGVAQKMVEFLIDDARAHGATEISLDATEMGKPLYKSLGFEENAAGMALLLKH
ncbi:MAG: GNAT family N-acetyltransferase [Treponema sp.]|nr:GNAT family N-acetyltransferase [Treponema sp.]